MKLFFRENPTIAFGLGLPLLLVLAFLLISGIPAILVDPPKYDVLYATEYYNNQEDVQFAVSGRKLQVSYRGYLRGAQVPRLWRYYAQTGAVQEIPILLPPERTSRNTRPAQAEDTPASIAIKVPELDGLVIDSSSIAPDGYEFSAGYERYSRNIFDGIFYSSRYRNTGSLEKDGRSIALPNADTRYYDRQTRFIGWVISQ
ncbi:MAG: hypothetical protein WBN40_14060 [Pseudomonadales bacterium]